MTAIRAFAVAVLATLCAACTDGTTPRGGTSPPGTTAASTAGPSTTVSAGRASTLAALRPCDLLSGAKISLYGYTEGRSLDAAPTRTCTYAQPATGRRLVVSFLATGLDALAAEDGDSVTTERVGVHTAERVRSATRALCTVNIGVGQDATVVVQAAGNETVDVDCAHALDAATAVEPRLP